MKRMKIISESCSSSRGLPDEIILEILNKVIDLRTLCFCKLVSKGFYKIVLEVDTISYTSHLRLGQNSSGFLKNLLWSLVNGVVLKPLRLMRHMVNDILNPATVQSECDPFSPVIVSLKEFRQVKSLRLQLPDDDIDDPSLLFKWKVNFGKENEIDSFLFLSPNYVSRHHMVSRCNIAQGDIDKDVVEKLEIAIECLEDARIRRNMMLRHMIRFPLLADVSITDSVKRGSTVSLCADKMAEMRKWLSSPAQNLEEKLDGTQFHCKVTQFYAPVLELPVSRYVMEEVTLILMVRNGLPEDNNRFLKSEDEDDFQGIEDAVYNEALKEILKDNGLGTCSIWDENQYEFTWIGTDTEF